MSDRTPGPAGSADGFALGAGGDLLDTAAAGPVAARGGAMRASGYVAGTLLAIVSVPLMIRHLGVEDFGRYVTVLAIVTIIAGLSEAGVNTIALREYASRAGADRTAAMRDLLGIRIVLTLAGIAIGVLFAILAGYSSVLVVGTLVVGTGFLLQSVQLLLTASLQGELRFGWVTAIELLRQVLFVGVIVVLVLTDAGLESFFAAQIPASAVALAVTAVLVRGIMPLRPSLHPARWWPLLRETVAYAAAIALNSMYFRVAIIGLSLLATERETGYFATAFRVVEVLIAIPPLFIGAAFPILARAARDNRTRLDTTTVRLIEVGLMVGVWVALGLALAAEPIVSLLAGTDSEPSAALLRVQGFALVATFVTVAGAFSLLSLRRHRTLLVANAFALLASVVLTLMLISRYEATGAAIAVLAGEVLLAIVIVGAIVRERPAVAEVLRRAPAILAAGAAAAAVALVPGLPPIADTAVALLAFPALLALLRRFPPEIGHALGGRRGGAASP